jgi:hypothetical protein
MAYFYCDFRRPESQAPVNVIGSLVAQLCSKLRHFPDELQQAFVHSSSGGQNRKPSLSILSTKIKLLARNQKIILLVDALDECDQRSDILKAISSLEAADNINILITSRAEVDIQDGLDFFTRLRIESRLSEVDEDIRKYINHRLESDQKLLWLKPSIRSDVMESLNSKSQGM